MNIFAKIYCRVFQTAFRMALPVLPYREPEIIRSCTELGKVAKKEKVSSVLIVTDKGIVKNGLVDPVVAALQTSGVSYYIYADTQPNPTVQNVEDAALLEKKFDLVFSPNLKLWERKCCGILLKP